MLRAGLFLNIDTSTKFVSGKTLEEEINELYDEGYKNHDIIKKYVDEENQK